MKIKKILTANLKIGMVTAEAVYNSSNHLVIASNTTLTPDIIDKLKYYSVRSVKILVPEEGKEIFDGIQFLNPQAQNGMTYYEKIQSSQETRTYSRIMSQILSSKPNNLMSEMTRLPNRHSFVGAK